MLRPFLARLEIKSLYFVRFSQPMIKSTIHRIEKLQRDFLWHGTSEERKFHLVDLNLVCRSKKEGGLGISTLRKVNQALLGKWIWRIGEDSEGLWHQVLASKHGFSRDGWDVQECSYKALSIWRGIMSAKESFMEQIRYRVGTGDGILFWLDNWIGDGHWLLNSQTFITVLQIRRLK